MTRSFLLAISTAYHWMEENRLKPQNTVSLAGGEMPCLASCLHPSHYLRLRPFGPLPASRPDTLPGLHQSEFTVLTSRPNSKMRALLPVDTSHFSGEVVTKLTILMCISFQSFLGEKCALGTFIFRFQWIGFYQTLTENQQNMTCAHSSKGTCCLMYMCLGLIKWTTVEPTNQNAAMPASVR